MGSLIMIRHGESELNTKKVFYGALDPNLTEKGREQCVQAKESLKSLDYDILYSSDLKRAAQTAKLVNYKDLDIVFAKEFRERSFGIFEGLTYEEILEKYPKEAVEWQADWDHYDYKTGESNIMFCKRVIDFAEKAIDKAQNTLIVAHWGVLNTLLSHYIVGDLSAFWKFEVLNAGIVCIDFCGTFPVLKALNYKA